MTEDEGAKVLTWCGLSPLLRIREPDTFYQMLAAVNAKGVPVSFVMISPEQMQCLAGVNTGLVAVGRGRTYGGALGRVILQLIEDEQGGRSS